MLSDIIVLILSTILSVVILICFFILCSNASKIRKSLLNPLDEYKTYKALGNEEKALESLIRLYYHEQRNYYDDFNKSKDWYKEELEKYGFDVEKLKKINNLD